MREICSTPRTENVYEIEVTKEIDDFIAVAVAGWRIDTQGNDEVELLDNASELEVGSADAIDEIAIEAEVADFIGGLKPHSESITEKDNTRLRPGLHIRTHV